MIQEKFHQNQHQHKTSNNETSNNEPESAEEAAELRELGEQLVLILAAKDSLRASGGG